MNGAPSTYSEWNRVLKELKAGNNDQAVLETMKHGTLDWQGGVAERFCQKLSDAVQSRLDSAVKRFQNAMTHAGMSEGEIVNAILLLRRELSFLYEAVDLPFIPDETRSSFTGLIIRQGESIQESLEDSARSDRSGKLSSIIRNHRVDTIKA